MSLGDEQATEGSRGLQPARRPEGSPVSEPRGPKPAAPQPGWGDPNGMGHPRGLSRAMWIVAVALLIGTYLLMSPPRAGVYPGAIPWRPFSVLRPLTELLSLNGLVVTARGVEIKDFALHTASVLGLLLLAVRAWSAPLGELSPKRLTEPWLAAQLLLGGWVVLSALSARWADDRALASGQAAIYALSLAWAVALAWTLDARQVPKLLVAVVSVSAVAAALCLWYYVERNPYHRPGFPLGNPGTLATALLPGILLSVGVLTDSFARWRRRRPPPNTLIVVGAIVALVPLLWCFALVNSRSAIVGLGVGLGAMLYFQAGGRLRWLIATAVVLGLAGAGVWLTNYSRFEAAMARSATIRFRFYAWRYAAELWNQNWLTSIAGHGAGAYPQWAGQLSVRDRVLDPAAFMESEMVEHAHNELFEVLVEIGLVGGVTFVGGWLATLAAGSGLLRAGIPRAQRWLTAALVASLAAMMADALTSPALRLPGPPAVFYTLLGAFWALCRAHARPTAAATLASLLQRATHAAPRGAVGHRLVGALAAVLALALSWPALRNGWAALREEHGWRAAAEHSAEVAVGDFDFAQAHLLDPVRQLINHWLAVRARLDRAEAACAAFYSRRAAAVESDSQPTTADVGTLRALWQTAVEDCDEAYRATDAYSRRAPTLMRAGVVGASAAEMLGQLYDGADATTAEHWYERALQVWRIQRSWRPYDVEALLSLTRYDAPVAFHVGLLRDALRSPTGRDRRDEPLPFEELRRRWHDALRRIAQEDGFDETLGQFLAAVGPVSAQTDLDTLVASLAPEVYRLTAQVEALRGNVVAAQGLAARAAALYAPMRARFPALESIALLEQAEFTLREAPARAGAAVELLRIALDRLPVIQRQKFEELARPFRVWLGVALLAGGQEGEAAETLRSIPVDQQLLPRALADAYVRLVALYIRQSVDTRPQVEAWLAAALRQQPDHVLAWGWRAWLAAERGDLAAVQSVLAEAARAGVQAPDLERIRNSLRQEFPALADRLRGGAVTLRDAAAATSVQRLRNNAL